MQETRALCRISIAAQFCESNIHCGISSSGNPRSSSRRQRNITAPDDSQMEFVNHPCAKVLLNRGDTAANAHVLILPSILRSLQRGMDFHP
jgi:hypothetical protein